MAIKFFILIRLHTKDNNIGIIYADYVNYIYFPKFIFFFFRLKDWLDPKMFSEFQRGDLVWFDPGIGYVLPGEVIEFHKPAQVSCLYISSQNKPANIPTRSFLDGFGFRGV